MTLSEPTGGTGDHFLKIAYHLRLYLSEFYENSKMTLLITKGAFIFFF